MKQPELIICTMQSEEYPLLREFLYQAIFLPEGTVPPSRSVIDLPELQIYIADFGTQFGDYCLVAEVNGKIAGAAWSRIMEDYGHIDKGTPSLAISLLPEYRGHGIGTKLLSNLLSLLYEKGFPQVSLSVQKKNPAFRLYKRAGFWNDTIKPYTQGDIMKLRKGVVDGTEIYRRIQGRCAEAGRRNGGQCSL